jgi:hypothetical protein
MTDPTTIPETGTALATIRTSLPTLIAADTDDILGSLRKELEGFEPDTSTERGRKAIATMAFKPRKAKAAFEKLADALKEDAQKTIKSTNAELKTMKELLDGLAVDIRRPLDEIEAVEEATRVANEAAIKTLEDLAIGLDTLTADEIKARYLESRKPFPWAPTFATRADRTIKGVVAQLQVAHQAAKEREAEAEERRISAHKIALADMNEASNVPYPSSAEAIRQIIRDFTGRAPRAWEEFESEATALHQACIDHLNECLGSAIKVEAEAQKARDAEIAAEATRLAEIEAARQAQEADKAAQAALQAEAERAHVAERLAQRLAAEAENNRVMALRNALAVMEKLAFPKTSAEAVIMVETDLATLAHVNDRDWAEFREEAHGVHAAVEAAVMGRLREAEVREKQAEVDRKASAEAKARQELADKQAADEAVAAEREKNVAHQRRVNGEIVADIMKAMEAAIPGGVDEAKTVAAAVMKALVKREIRHVGPVAY